MTKSDVMKEFLKKTVIPVVVVLFCFQCSAVSSSRTERPIIS